MAIDRKMLEQEKKYVHKLLSYMYKDVEIQLNEVILDKRDPHVVLKDRAIISLLEGNEYAYVSIKDKNINIQAEKKYHISFEGELQGNPHIELHIQMYDCEGKKLEKSHVAQINQTAEIKFADDTQYIKLLVRIAGSGVLMDSAIKLQALGEWVKPKQDNSLRVEREDYTDIDVEKYITHTVCNITQVSSDILYTECKTIQMGSTIEVDCEERGQYISLYEKNVNFSALPSIRPIDINDEHTYYINFKGEGNIELKAQLFVIVYSQSTKEEVYQIALNQCNTISPSRGSKYMRLALRVEGKGSLEISGIEITSRKKIGFIGHRNLKKLGFDTPKQLSDIKMACIFDEFTTECYKYSCQLMPITPDDWKAQFTIQKPHLLMVESAWVGNNGAWARKVAYTSENNIKELRELIEWCKVNQIPTVFWNKEDPVHYDVFINTAKMFDYIFTTDENRVSNYKRDAHNEHVYVLPFAAQPKIHNPIKISGQRDPRACFAGSYYAAKYPERQEDIDRLLDAAVETTGIEIYDRYFNTDDKDFLFPERFREYIKGNLKPDELHIANKGYKVMINVNSVKESPTMFSRRVFEGLACGTPVISSYSEGINNIFYNIVVASDDKEVLVNELYKLNNELSYYDAKSIVGIREVLKYHTYIHRLELVLDKVGLDIKDRQNEISILIEAHNVEEMRKGIAIFDSQLYKNKKLILAVNNDEEFFELINKNGRKDISFVFMDYYNKHKIKLEKIISSNYMAIMDTNNYYAPYYLEDILLAYSYAEADIIGKFTYFNSQDEVINKGYEYRYVSAMNYDRCIISKNLFKSYNYFELKQLLTEANNELLSRGARIFAIDKYNYIENNDREINSDLIIKKMI